MRLSKTEFLAMNNPVRRVLQKHLEFALFKKHLKKRNISLTGKIIMDAGCGSGYSSQLILNEFKPSKLISFDFMPEQIYLARKRNIAVDFFIGDLRKLETPDNTCDAVFIFGVLHHIPEWKTALREIARVLKPEGVLLVEEPQTRFNWPEFENGLNTDGFKILEKSKVLVKSFQSFLCLKTVNQIKSN